MLSNALCHDDALTPDSLARDNQPSRHRRFCDIGNHICSQMLEDDRCKKIRAQLASLRHSGSPVQISVRRFRECFSERSLSTNMTLMETNNHRWWLALCTESWIRCARGSTITTLRPSDSEPEPRMCGSRTSFWSASRHSIPHINGKHPPLGRLDNLRFGCRVLLQVRATTAALGMMPPTRPAAI